MSYEAQLYDGLEDIALEALREREAHEASNKVIKYVKEPVWVTKDGRAIKVCDMDTQHIKNCLHMIYQSNGSWRTGYIRIFENELRRRKFGRISQAEARDLGRIVAAVLRSL